MRTKGAYNRSSRYSFKVNRPRCLYNQGDYKYIPLPAFGKKYFLSRSQIYTLMRDCKVYVMQHKGRLLVRWVDENIKDGRC